MKYVLELMKLDFNQIFNYLILTIVTGKKNK
jgi:hypothetical protein